ncbi:hypothetical protein [Belnapia rosea]|uniref:Uncharacterized protein n=1 Tax=Belnapia rosea TaxID=938405 RepID=A0A1G6K5K5_9PROT|nr:hypothetical protein [Belnapia rosea]SDB16483.1 hypothetical protein SAMN02927895_00583 [Belnapia rosea]SDC26121.1 hypothetical protein SAMN04487779_1001391 [Belnapia rosea]
MNRRRLRLAGSAAGALALALLLSGRWAGFAAPLAVACIGLLVMSAREGSAQDGGVGDGREDHVGVGGGGDGAGDGGGDGGGQ